MSESVALDGAEDEAINWDELADGIDGEESSGAATATADADSDTEGARDAGEGAEEATERADRGDGRDAQGRFAPKEGKQDANAEGTRQPAAEEATTAAAPDATTQRADAAAAETDEQAGEPFSVRVDGEDFALDGAEYYPGQGLYVPDAEVPTVRQLLTEGAYYKRNWRDLEQRAMRKGAEEALRSAPEIAEARTYMAEMAAVLESPEALTEFVEDFHQKRGILKERAEKAALKAELDAKNAREKSGETERQRADEEARTSGALENTIRSLADSPELRGVFSDDDLGAIYARCQRLLPALVRTADRDYPEHGLSRGEKYLAAEEIEDWMRTIAQERRAARDAAEQAKRQAKAAEEAARFNAANTPKPTPAAPARTRQPATMATPDGKPLSSREHLRQFKRKWYSSPDLSLDDEDDDDL